MDFRKKTVRWTVFADVATSVSEAIDAVASEMSPSVHQIKKQYREMLLFLFGALTRRDSNKEGESLRIFEKTREKKQKIGDRLNLSPI